MIHKTEIRLPLFPRFGLTGAAWGVNYSQALLFCLLMKETLFTNLSNGKWFLRQAKFFSLHKP